jgi:hypothetical protein
LIDKRAAGRDASDAFEMAWKASVRKHNARLRLQRMAEWHEFYSRLAYSHARLAERFEARAEALLQDGNERSNA